MTISRIEMPAGENESELVMMITSSTLKPHTFVPLLVYLSSPSPPPDHPQHPFTLSTLRFLDRFFHSSLCATLKPLKGRYYRDSMSSIADPFLFPRGWRAIDTLSTAFASSQCMAHLPSRFPFHNKQDL